MEKQNLIKLFEKIRDIPYRCPESIKDKDYRCWGKNRLLMGELKKRGYQARIRVCKFKWSKQHLPKEITSQAPRDEDIHPFIEVLLDGRWTILDSTFDKEFPKYNKWDGKSDCSISIRYYEICSPEESEKINKEEDFTKRDKEWLKYHKELNKFIKKLRER